MGSGASLDNSPESSTDVYKLPLHLEMKWVVVGCGSWLFVENSHLAPIQYSNIDSLKSLKAPML